MVRLKMHIYYPEAYNDTLWEVSNLKGCTGYVENFSEYAVYDADGGIVIASCPTKEYADIIAEKLNGKKIMKKEN